MEHSSVLRNAPLVSCAVAMVNENFRKSTVPHSSTNCFSSNENLRAKFLRAHDSEPEAARLSSVKDVTATRAVQLIASVSLKPKRDRGWEQLDFDVEERKVGSGKARDAKFPPHGFSCFSSLGSSPEGRSTGTDNMPATCSGFKPAAINV